MSLLLTLNAGSSSLKFALFERSPGLPEIGRGQVERLGSRPRLVFEAWGRTLEHGFAPDQAPADASAAFAPVWAVAREAAQGRPVSIIVHRVVHGGPERTGATVLDTAVLADLARLSPLAPLHQPHALAVVAAAAEQAPHALQIACFDTAFHRGGGFAAETYALPRELYAAGVRRYGFHGLSYASVLERLRIERDPAARGRLVIAHLGAGCSMAAVEDGRSLATTMGFSALEGLPMNTRCGRLDPGVVLWLMREQGLSVEEVEELLYLRSGLLGLSEVSGDMRDLEASDDPRAAEAVEHFVRRCAAAVGEMAAELGGLHGLVFTGGMGEKAAGVRARIVRACAWLGFELDEAANAAHARLISTAASPLRALVVPTDEERRMAFEAVQLPESASVTA